MDAILPVGQAAHASAPLELMKPGVQGEQAVELFAGAAKPDEHGLHASEPASAEMRPAAQAAQLVGDLPRVPGGHGVQSDAADATAMRPFGHVEHALSALPKAYVPGMQATQALAPAALA